MKKSTKRILFVAGATVASIYAYNKYVEYAATKKKLLSRENGEIYAWKYGDIFYTKSGSGAPLLLIHDADPTASSAEWNKILHKLEKHYTVYAIDLLGCGLSDKPGIDYTNYFYVELISSFINNVIGEKTSVIATNLSASFVVMTNHLYKNLIDKMILINPISLKKLNTIPDKTSILKKNLIKLPFIGTFIYNLFTSTINIDNAFQNIYYTKPQLVSSSLKDIYYESAHTNKANGRFLLSSIKGNYINNSISHALKNISTPTLIIGSNHVKGNSLVLDDYHKVNPDLDIMRINNGNLYPHMEIPEKITSIIYQFINK